MKNLILGAAKGYGWDILEPFVTSWRKNCSDAELVLFVDDVSDFTRDKLIRAGVRLEKFPDLYGIPNNTRWKIISDYLDAHGDDYETVFVTDTRDVIFQGDIFAAFDDCKNWLGFATEIDDIRGTVTGNQNNYNWLVGCFGKAQTDKLADKKIICSGTIIDSSRKMKTFCRKLWRILEPKVAEEIYDQAATNWLVYNGRVPVENILYIDVERGEIFTAYLYNFKYPLAIRDGIILRGDGGVPEVVHQYDRRDEIIRFVDEIYRDRNFSVNARFADTRSLLEQIACLLCVDKTAEATRLFLKIFFAVTNFDIYVNALIQIWTIALRQNFTPAVETIELAVQNALLSVKKFSDTQLIAIHKTLIHAQENRHAVDPAFKVCLVNHLLKLVEYNLNSRDEKGCFLCLKMIQSLGMPPDENFQRVVNDANRIFGHKN